MYRATSRLLPETRMTLNQTHIRTHTRTQRETTKPTDTKCHTRIKIHRTFTATPIPSHLLGSDAGLKVGSALGHGMSILPVLLPFMFGWLYTFDCLSVRLSAPTVILVRLG